MNKTQYLLGQIAQEAAEVAQEAIKCQQFGLDGKYEDSYHNPDNLNNAKRLEAELRDLISVVEILNAQADCMETFVSYNPSHWHVSRKSEKIEKFSKFAKDVDFVEL